MKRTRDCNQLYTLKIELRQLTYRNPYPVSPHLVARSGIICGNLN